MMRLLKKLKVISLFAYFFFGYFFCYFFSYFFCDGRFLIFEDCWFLFDLFLGLKEGVFKD